MRYSRAVYRRRSGKAVPASWTNAEIELVAERAYQLHLQGKHLDATIIFEGILAIDPENVYCLKALAALSLKLGSPEDVLKYADRALTLSPNEVEALACRCEANILLNRIADAQRDLESIRRLRAEAHVVRLAMRIASVGKSPSNLLPDATSRELER